MTAPTPNDKIPNEVKALWILLAVFVALLLGVALALGAPKGATQLTQVKRHQTTPAAASIFLPMASPPPRTNQLFLTWDGPEDATGYHVFIGPARLEWTNNFIVHTNLTPYVPGLHYGVATVGDGGLESAIAYFPSNRISELWLGEYTTNFANVTNVFLLERYTNHPGAPQRFWQIKDVTVGWE